MKLISYPMWPGGRIHAVTFSYDDGKIQDRRVVEILNRHGFKGTFNLNGSRVGAQNVVTAEEIPALFAGHEVACHFFTHPFPTRIPCEQVLLQVLEDRKRLEAITGGLVEGMAYPNGDYNAKVIESLRACGIRYSRTTKATESFAWSPEEWLAWHPTCHDKMVTPAMMDRFFTVRPWDRNGRLFFIWGHSYEFDREGGWETFETLCRTLRERGGDTVWAATNGMIRDYADAARSLRFGSEGQRVSNPSALDVWISADGKPLCVPAGKELGL